MRELQEYFSFIITQLFSFIITFISIKEKVGNVPNVKIFPEDTTCCVQFYILLGRISMN